MSLLSFTPGEEVSPLPRNLTLGLRQLASKHIVFMTYACALSFLIASVSWDASIQERAFAGVLTLMCFFAGLVFTYWALWRAVGEGLCASLRWRASVQRNLSDTYILLFWLAVGLYLVSVCGHLYALNQIPLFASFWALSDVDISIVRQGGYNNSPSAVRYICDFLTKAVGPGLLLLAAHYRLRAFAVIAGIGSIYALALLPKVLPIYLFLPTIVYFGFKSWVRAAALSGIMLVLVLTLTVLQNADIRSSFVSRDAQVHSLTHQDIGDSGVQGSASSALLAIAERTLAVPGRTINQWIAYYSSGGPFEEGCGIRPLSFLLNCQYIDVPRKLYSYYYPAQVAEGLRGNLNAASFMIDYANFGPAGFVVSILCLATVFVISAVVFSDHVLALPCNIALIVALMESGFTTALISGSGWILTVVGFFLIFRSRQGSSSIMPSSTVG